MKLPPQLEQFLPQFQYAWEATKIESRPEYDVALLAAICRRESNGGLWLTPKGPSGTGDKGHGHGLMQIDDRTWGPWLALTNAEGSPLWTVPAHNILKGAQILKQGILATQSVEGGVCAYNAGPLAAKRALQSVGPDAPLERRIEALDQKTTGKNYVSWVLARAAHYRAETTKE